MRPILLVTAVFCAGLLVIPTLHAEETAPALEPLDEELPQVTIVTRGEDTVTEFRLRGKLYLVKVTQPNGAVYHLVDREGRGQWIRDDNAPGLAIPNWVLTTW